MNQTTVLDNGLRIHTRSLPSILAQYQLFVPFGGDTLAYKDANNVQRTLRPGSAHFFEHVLFIMPPEGYIGTRTPEKAPPGLRDGLTVLKNNKATSVNAYTNDGTTNYYFRTRQNAMENLSIMLGYVCNPFLPHDRLTEEVGTIGDEIAMYDNSSEYMHFQKLKRQLYHRHSTRHDVLGTKDDISQITIADVLALHETFYTPSNMILTAIGNVDHDEIIRTVQKVMKQLGKTSYTPPPVLPYQREPESVVRIDNFATPFRRKDVVRPSLLMAWKEVYTPEYLDDTSLLEDMIVKRALASTLLCNGGSYMREWLVQQGLDERTLGMSASAVRDHAEILVTVETDTPERTAEIFRQAANRLVHEPLTDAVFEDARNSILMGFDSVQNNIGNISKLLVEIASCTNDPDSFDRHVARVKNITKEEVQAVLPRVYAPHKCTACVMEPGQ